MSATPRATIVGAGHNGLVAAVLLARGGVEVQVLEAADVVGGAALTEHPFAAAPGVGASTGAYLLGPFPPELHDLLGMDLPLLRRDPHYFLPDPSSGYLLIGSDGDANRAAFTARFGEADWEASQALAAELDALRTDLAPAWLQEPRTLEETAEAFIRPELRSVFTDLVTGSALDYLRRFGFASDDLLAMYAVTDAAPGHDGDPDSPGSGANLLVHNMARLPGSDGTWMVVKGGMGTVTQRLAQLAEKAGAQIETDARVVGIDTERGLVMTEDCRERHSDVVIVNADPYRLQGLVGPQALYDGIDARIDAFSQRRGTTLKINLALRSLPVYTCLPEDVGQHGTTTHLLPRQEDVLAAVHAAYAAANAGELPDEPPIEVYTHTAVDPSLQDADGTHSAAMFVQWVPNRLADGRSWADVAETYADHLMGLWEAWAPGVSDLVVDRQILHPAAIEEHFGLTHGHIFHVDNSFVLDQRLPYRVGPKLYACGAGCHPAGSVIGAAGHNAAQAVLADLGLPANGVPVQEPVGL